MGRARQTPTGSLGPDADPGTRLDAVFQATAPVKGQIFGTGLTIPRCLLAVPIASGIFCLGVRCWSGYLIELTGHGRLGSPKRAIGSNLPGTLLRQLSGFEGWHTHLGLLPDRVIAKNCTDVHRRLLRVTDY